jgi:arabinan endo-1,5-alpha-L-arabinosidase
MIIGRSKKITGPFIDKEGMDMAKGGGTILLQGDSKWYGVGHNALASFDGTDYLVFHPYDANDNCRPKLRIAKLTWQVMV